MMEFSRFVFELCCLALKLCSLCVPPLRIRDVEQQFFFSSKMDIVNCKYGPVLRSVENPLYRWYSIAFKSAKKETLYPPCL